MVDACGFRDLYSAWESSIIRSVDDYQIEGTENKVEATVCNFIERAPKILCI